MLDVWAGDSLFEASTETVMLLTSARPNTS